MHKSCQAVEINHKKQFHEHEARISKQRVMQKCANDPANVSMSHTGLDIIFLENQLFVTIRNISLQAIFCNFFIVFCLNVCLASDHQTLQSFLRSDRQLGVLIKTYNKPLLERRNLNVDMTASVCIWSCFAHSDQALIRITLLFSGVVQTGAFVIKLITVI